MLNKQLDSVVLTTQINTASFCKITLCICLFLFSASSIAVDTNAFSHPVMTNLSSTGNHYQLSIFSKYPKPPVNALHQWVVEVQDSNNQAIAPALVEVAGGMPGHGHGLPTQPQMTKDLGNGRYLIEGIKFNMDGKWLIKLRITTPKLRDIAQFDLDVSY